MDNWVRTDEAEDVVGSARHAIRTLQFVGDDPQAWKWVIMALHSALQGACVCHLGTSAPPVGAVNKSNAREWLEYLDQCGSDGSLVPPETRLMNLPELLKAVRKPASAGGPGADVQVAISDRELSWLVRFHTEFRNQFAHFEPIGWSIEMSGIPGISSLIARIIGDIFECGWAFRHLSSTSREDLKKSLRSLSTLR